MITINDTYKFENIILNIENESNKIKEIFSKSNNNIEKINGTESWNGIAQEEFINKYNELRNSYESINQSLRSYITFMRNTVNSYNSFNQKAINEVDNNI